MAREAFIRLAKRQELAEIGAKMGAIQECSKQVADVWRESSGHKEVRAMDVRGGLRSVGKGAAFVGLTVAAFAIGAIVRGALGTTPDVVFAEDGAVIGDLRLQKGPREATEMQMTRSMGKVTLLFVAWAFALGIALGPQPARSLGVGGTIGDLAKIFGIGWVVNRFADDIDGGINTFLQQQEAAIEQQKKVAPIMRVGAAQVMGPRIQVQKVQAVAELQLDIGSLRGRALIPVSTKNVKAGVKGVGGVGVSANIKFPI